MQLTANTPNADPLTLNEKNEIAFSGFKAKHKNNPEFKDKFVVFVHGELQGVGNEELALVDNTYEKFGNVPMFVGRITDRKKAITIPSPRFE